jgi:hypothetical protein
VRQGGHDVQKPDVLRRFDRGWRNFLSIYQELADNESSRCDIHTIGPINTSSAIRTDLISKNPSKLAEEFVTQTTTAAIANPQIASQSFTKGCVFAIRLMRSNADANRPTTKFQKPSRRAQSQRRQAPL